MKGQLSDQVKVLLRLVAVNADLVCEGIEGPILAGENKRNARIDSVVGAGVLRVEDEQTFRLNPRLKSFVEDHLGTFQAFRSLTRIDSTVRHADRLWREVQALHRDGEEADAQKVEIELGEVFAEIAYDIDRNLMVLNANVATQFGNVDSLKAKIRQNRFFLSEVKSLSASVQKLGVTADRMFEECVQGGVSGVAQSLRRNLTSRLLNWSQQINEAQASISRRMFHARKLEERLGRLSRVALWVRQRSGLGQEREFDIDESVNPVLIRQRPIRLRAHVDVRDVESSVQEAMVECARSLPEAQERERKEITSTASEVERSEPEVAVEVLEPHEEALLKLVESASRSRRPISLVDWKANEPLLSQLSDEEWILYASTQVEAEGLSLAFLFAQQEAGTLNERYYDAMVSA